MQEFMQELQLAEPALTQLNPVEFAFNLFLCIVAAFLLRTVYVKRSISLSGKFHIGTVIPILACVTFLVIMVVKSSLALSLGLVGALSVVRFRTPIKEPEELVYLFLAIALGLGYGAGQSVVTSVVFLVILVLIVLWLSRTSVAKQDEYNLMIDWREDDVEVKTLLDAIASHTEQVEMQKYNVGETGSSLFLKIMIHDLGKLEAILRQVKAVAPGSNCSFYEARPLQ